MVDMDKMDYEIEDFYASLHYDEDNRISVYVADETKEDREKKKKSEFLCVLIYGLIALVVAFGTFKVTQKFYKNEEGTTQTQMASDDYEEDIVFEEEETEFVDQQEEPKQSIKTGESNSIAVSTGTIKANSYSNDWIGVNLNVPNDYIIYPKDEYSNYSDEYNECILYAMNDVGDSIICQVTDVQGLYGKSNITEEEYIKELSKEYESADVIVASVGAVEEITIAGEIYKSAHYNIQLGDENIVQSMYAKRIDNKMCTFMITGNESTVEKNNNIVKTFR